MSVCHFYQIVLKMKYKKVPFEITVHKGTYNKTWG